jgi:hypothetical protein
MARYYPLYGCLSWRISYEFPPSKTPCSKVSRRKVCAELSSFKIYIIADFNSVFCWGIVIACSAAATDFKALMVVRFLLGLFESCVQPAFIIMYVYLFYLYI